MAKKFSIPVWPRLNVVGIPERIAIELLKIDHFMQQTLDAALGSFDTFAASGVEVRGALQKQVDVGPANTNEITLLEATTRVDQFDVEGAMVLVDLAGQYTSGGVPPNLTVRLYLGGRVAASVGAAAPPASVTSRLVRIRFEATRRPLKAAYVVGEVQWTDPSVTLDLVRSDFTAGGFSPASKGKMPIKVTAQWATSGGATSLSLQTGRILVLGGPSKKG